MSNGETNQLLLYQKPYLYVLYMDLFWRTNTWSLGGKGYTLIPDDEFPRYTCLTFSATKDEPLKSFSKLLRKIKNQKGFMVSKIRSDHVSELEDDVFENSVMKTR